MAKKVVNRREPEDTDWLSHHEVAGLFGVKPETVHSWVRTQKPNPNAPVASDADAVPQDFSKIPYRRTFKGLGSDGKGVPVLHFPRQAIYDLLDSKKSPSRVGRTELFQSGRQVENLRCHKCNVPMTAESMATHHQDTHAPFRCKTCGKDVSGKVEAMKHKSEEHPE